MGKWSDGVTALRRTEGDGERGTAVKKCDETAAVRAAAGNAAADSGPGLGQMGWGGGTVGLGKGSGGVAGLQWIQTTARGAPPGPWGAEPRGPPGATLGCGAEHREQCHGAGDALSPLFWGGRGGPIPSSRHWEPSVPGGAVPVPWGSPVTPLGVLRSHSPPDIGHTCPPPPPSVNTGGGNDGSPTHPPPHPITQEGIPNAPRPSHPPRKERTPPVPHLPPPRPPPIPHPGGSPLRPSPLALNAAPHDVIRGFPPKRSPAAHTGLNPGRAARRHGNTRARPPQRRSHWSVPPRPGCCGAALKGAATPPKDDPRVVAAAGLRDPRRCPRRGAARCLPLPFMAAAGGGGPAVPAPRSACCLSLRRAAGRKWAPHARCCVITQEGGEERS